MLNGNLVYSALVTTALEGGGEEGLDHLNGLFMAHETAGHGDDVGIVMLACQLCNLGNPAQCRANALMLVQRHVDALTATAHGNAGVALATLNGVGAQVGKVGIVTTVGGVSSEILVFNALFFEIIDYGEFGVESGVVAAQCYGNAGFQN